jgi:hypothetical protein
VLNQWYVYYIQQMTDYKEQIQLYREKINYDMQMVWKYIQMKNYVMVHRYYYSMFIQHFLTFRLYITRYMIYLRQSNQGTYYTQYQTLLNSMATTYTHIS